jgi:hypothetical protein
MVQRLMILDGVLRDRNCWWMDTERDKRSYFSTTRHTGLSASEYPQIAFGGGPQKTIRYFPTTTDRRSFACIHERRMVTNVRQLEPDWPLAPTARWPSKGRLTAA